MKRIEVLIVIIILFSGCQLKKASQHAPSAQIEKGDPGMIDLLMKEEKADFKRPIHHPSDKRVNDLIHTKLEVSFIWKTKQLKGEAELTLKPYFYETDSLILDAKALDIEKVTLIRENGKEVSLAYNVSNSELKIKLDKTYSKTENYSVKINYTANPEEVEENGGAAIAGAKGLYFINADSSEKNKPTQIWTQGETEASSCWFPTIDSPNEKCTQEIYITVDQRYKTLSNGLLIYSTPNENGTKTDYWKMDKPHSPYLFMLAIGDFSIVEDAWTRADGSKMAVNYYVEEEYKEHAKAIFGKTPRMIDYFSKILGVEYPWDKYHQVVVRDYVSGAMENTTAVIHGEFLQQTKREMIDGDNESIIAHELFHHWFGDLVTCESWSNLPLNESFANYSQFLWDEYEYGRMTADKNAFSEMEGYILSAQQQGAKDLIRFDYTNKDEMFDAVSYNKGGRILHMLRSYVGDDAFFQSLKKYLLDNAYNTAEIHDLRLAFEETTGEDLNWFFDQWFLAGGHPVLDITQRYSDSTDLLSVLVSQKQNLDEAPLYKVPVQIEIYVNHKRSRKLVWLEKVRDTFEFELPAAPQLVVVDAQKVILCEKKVKKSENQWIYQLKHAPLYLDKKEALEELGKSNSQAAKSAIINALEHPFWHIRLMAMKKSKKSIRSNKAQMKDQIVLLTTDDHPQVRTAALKMLKKHWEGDGELLAIYQKAVKDSSYNVMAQGIEGYAEIDKEKAMAIAKEFEREGGAVAAAIARIYAKYGGKEEHTFFIEQLGRASGFSKYGLIQTYNNFLMRQDENEMNKGLSVFEDLARNGSPWFIKLSGYQLLSNAAEAYTKKAEQQGLDYAKFMKEGNTSGAAISQQSKIHSEQKSLSIIELVNKLKAEEDDKNVLQYINYRE
jgi:aminopeptidase N